MTYLYPFRGYMFLALDVIQRKKHEIIHFLACIFCKIMPKRFCGNKAISQLFKYQFNKELNFNPLFTIFIFKVNLIFRA